MPNKPPERIVGIDPGYDRLGIAVIERTKSAKKERLLYSTCIQTSPRDDIYTRLLSIGRAVAAVLEEYQPTVLALETLFITKNQKTAMRVAEARGIIIYEAIQRKIAVFEYGPMEIKLAITGDGSSDKLRVTKMVNLLVDNPPQQTLDDEYDAVAVALTQSARHRLVG